MERDDEVYKSKDNCQDPQMRDDERQKTRNAIETEPRERGLHQGRIRDMRGGDV
jgi:hypothetical protein